MKSVLLGVALATAIAGTSAAGDWRLLSVGRAGAIAVDIDGVRSAGERRTGWTALMFPLTTQGMDYMLVRYEWNCDTLESTKLGWVAYTADGQNVGHSDARDPSVAAAPDSNEIHIFNAVCHNVFQIQDEGWTSVMTLLRDYRTTPPQ